MIDLVTRIPLAGLMLVVALGFLLGRVTAVDAPPGALRQEIALEPAVPLPRLEDVFVVTAVSPHAPGFPLPAEAPDSSAQRGGGGEGGRP